MKLMVDKGELRLAINRAIDAVEGEWIDEPRSDVISRQAAIDALKTCQTYVFDKRDPDNKISLESAEYEIEQLPSAQPEPISEEYAKAVRTWLINYQVRCAELAGRYTPYEILGWIVSDWRKENEIW